MAESQNILVIQTAFLGDVILTLPLVQAVKKYLPSSRITFVVVPRAAELLAHHPSIDEVLVFDKRGTDKGVKGLLRMAMTVKKRKFDTAFIPHRSLRSAMLAFMGKIAQRIGFDKGAGRFLLTHVVNYEPSLHEIRRNLRLIEAIDADSNSEIFPLLYPSDDDRSGVDRLLAINTVRREMTLVGIAPGTVWKTKQWPPERYIELVEKLTSKGCGIALIGGKEDAELCQRIAQSPSRRAIVVAAGKLSLLQSAELIRRCRVLVCNDSAPMHLAGAVRTPVVALFGATVPEFGFAPFGDSDIIMETKGLKCRPCSIHGGDVCPIRTFECMMNISSDAVYKKVLQIIEKPHTVG